MEYLLLMFLAAGLYGWYRHRAAAAAPAEEDSNPYDYLFDDEHNPLDQGD